MFINKRSVNNFDSIRFSICETCHNQTVPVELICNSLNTIINGLNSMGTSISSVYDNSIQNCSECIFNKNNENELKQMIYTIYKEFIIDGLWWWFN